MNSLALIESCHQIYHRENRCEDCQNSDCQGGCGACLDAIHMNRIKRRYNCKNITYFYVCKYLLKYMSEFYHLFENNKNLCNLEKYNIFSIGCGPCSDLFGIAKHLTKNGKSLPIKYIGVDLNEQWGDVHQFIQNIAEESMLDIAVRFHNNDIFQSLESLESSTDVIPINIVTLHYVLSDMVANNLDINDFLNKFYTNIVNRLPSGAFIILNDINHYNTRDYFDHFFCFLQQNGNYEAERYHFFNNNRTTTYYYGEKHLLNSLSVEIPHYLYDYNVWQFCSSSQMLIKKI